MNLAISTAFFANYLLFSRPYLRQAKLRFIGSLTYLEDKFQFFMLLAPLYKKDWYVYCKRPFKTANSVLEYLGRYTHRVAISNHRIVSMENGNVTFKWRDYREDSKEKLMTLTAFEFIRRFLLHILPPGFTKIRHYGLLASAVKKKKLALCFKLTGQLQLFVQGKKLTAVELIKKITGNDISICPVCGLSLARASPILATA